jgi:hypothetical protein
MHGDVGLSKRESRRCERGSLEELGEKPRTINTTRERCLLFINGLIIHSWRLGLKKKKEKQRKTKAEIESRKYNPDLGSK